MPEVLSPASAVPVEDVIEPVTELLAIAASTAGPDAVTALGLEPFAAYGSAGDCGTSAWTCR